MFRILYIHLIRSYIYIIPKCKSHLQVRFAQTFIESKNKRCSLRVGKQNPWKADLVSRPCNFVCNLVQSCNICTSLQKQLLAAMAQCKLWQNDLQSCTSLQVCKDLAKWLHRATIAPCKICTILPRTLLANTHCCQPELRYIHN